MDVNLAISVLMIYCISILVTFVMFILTVKVLDYHVYVADITAGLIVSIIPLFNCFTFIICIIMLVKRCWIRLTDWYNSVKYNKVW